MTSSSTFLDDPKIIDFFAGGVSGGLAKLVEYPADTVKTRMQSGRYADKTSLQVIFDIVKNEGALKGFYRGVAMPLVSCGAEVAVTFTVYNHVTESLLQNDGGCGVENNSWKNSSVMKAFGLSDLKRHRDEHSYKTVAAASAVAGVANGFLLTPLEVVKCRCQANPEKYFNVRQCIKVSVAEEGLRVFASGASGTFAREIPGTMAFFLSLESAIRYFFPHHRVTQKEVDDELLRATTTSFSSSSSSSVSTPSSSSFLAPGDLREDGTTPFYVKPLAGCFAGIGLMLFPFPIDTIKTLTQTSPEYNKMGFFGTGRDIFKKFGFRYFYRGLPITLARAAPGNALVFTCYDLVSTKLMMRSEERQRKFWQDQQQSEHLVM